MKARTLLALACLAILVPNIAPACTAFCAAAKGRVLVGNNEDFGNPRSRIWFVPAEKGRHGRVLLGFDDGFAQGGMNEKGLLFADASGDAVAIEPDDVVRKKDWFFVQTNFYQSRIPRLPLPAEQAGHGAGPPGFCPHRRDGSLLHHALRLLRGTHRLPGGSVGPCVHLRIAEYPGVGGSLPWRPGCHSGTSPLSAPALQYRSIQEESNP